MVSLRRLMALVVALIPAWAPAAESLTETQRSAGGAGASGLWILANLSYAGMRAQNNASTGWRVVAFIFGFPGTLITWLVVDEGGERAYGVDVPKRR